MQCRQRDQRSWVFNVDFSPCKDFSRFSESFDDIMDCGRYYSLPLHAEKPFEHWISHLCYVSDWAHGLKSICKSSKSVFIYVLHELPFSLELGLALPFFVHLKEPAHWVDSVTTNTHVVNTIHFLLVNRVDYVLAFLSVSFTEKSNFPHTSLMLTRRGSTRLNKQITSSLTIRPGASLEPPWCRWCFRATQAGFWTPSRSLTEATRGASHGQGIRNHMSSAILKDNAFTY